MASAMPSGVSAPRSIPTGPLSLEIRGLTEDIDGSYIISGTNGTSISICFDKKKLTESLDAAVA